MVIYEKFSRFWGWKMFLQPNEYEYYLRPGRTDMRFGARRLAALVITEMQQQVLGKSMFLFCGSSNKVIKVLVWDKNGFWLGTKRLMGKGSFAWPSDGEAAQKVELNQILQMLSGQDCWRRFAPLKGTYFV